MQKIFIHLKHLVDSGRSQDLYDYVNQLSLSDFWSVYADIFNPLMTIGVSKQLYKKHLDFVKGNTVLDIGAGTGLISIPLLEKGFEVLAVEPAEAMSKKIEQIVCENEFQSQFKLIKEPFDSNFSLGESVDHVVLKYVLYGLPKPKECLSNIYDLLSAGGAVSISNPLPLNVNDSDFEKFIQDLESEMQPLNLGWKLKLLGPINKRLASQAVFYSLDQLEAILSDIGFKIFHKETIRTALFVVAQK